MTVVDNPRSPQELETALAELRIVLFESARRDLDRPAHEILQALGDQSAPPQQTLDAVAALFVLGIGRVTAPFENSRPLLQRVLDVLVRVGVGAATLGVGSQAQRVAAAQLALPDNWERLSAQDLESAVRLARDEQICTAWSPDPVTVRELLDAESAVTREGVLVDRLPAIALHCLSALSAVRTPRLGAVAQLAGRAAKALSDGHHEAALALSTAVTTSVLENLVPRPSGGISRHGRDLDPRTVEARVLSRSIVLAAAGSVFENTQRGSVPDSQLNRHLVVHNAPAAQFTVANAARAVILASALILDEDRTRANEGRYAREAAQVVHTPESEDHQGRST